MLEVLDLAQLNRIEATHRGFLYQHLFAVGCLLKGDADLDSVVVEHDEDLELVTRERHIYAQIKTRTATLLEGELEGFFSRVQQLAAAHTDGRRSRSPEFWLVTNTKVSEGLALRLAAENVALWSPHDRSREEPFFPPPHLDVPASLAWCEKAAAQIAMTRLSPDTLVWKLAAVVAYRSAGLEGGHSILTSDLASLFEIFAAQLHHFPESPTGYRLQENEPRLEGDDHVLLVVSVSGAGKTAWASRSALHCGFAVIYFDAAGLPDAAVASSLLREVIAQFAAQSGRKGNDVVNSGASGWEGLRAVDLLAKHSGERPIVVIDNVHTLTARTIERITTALASCRLVLLGQPSPVAAELEERLGLAAAMLGGWSLMTIAAEFASAQSPADPASAAFVRRLTGGIPHFVKNAASLTKQYYSGNVNLFCSAIESCINTTRTAQELILRESFERLSPNAKLASSLMSLARFPLSESECLDYLSAHESFRMAASAAHAIRELRDWGVVQRLISGALVTHDAFLSMAAAQFETLEPDIKMAAKQKLVAIVEDSVAPGQVARLSIYCRLLPQIGKVEALADIASSLSELIHEQGRSADLEIVLEDVLLSSEASALDKFLIADTLALWEFQRLDKSRFVELVRTMERLAKERDLGLDTASRLAMKQMLEASLNHEFAGIRLYSSKSLTLAETPLLRRIALYNTAVAWFMADKPEMTIEITEHLLVEYYDVLKLSDKDVIGVSAKALSDALAPTLDTKEELKRFADTLDLRARALNQMRLPSGLCRLHAMKFYQIAHMPVSLMKVGQDVVDEFLDLLGDPWEARSVIEGLLLPIVTEYQLIDYVVPVKAQYAVVLAYCGEIEPARQLMAQLKAFGASDHRQNELENQTCLIESIAIKNPFGVRPKIEPNVPRVGRNEHCPCGSGKKYKRCHGA